VAQNVLEHGTGGINVDASRIGTEENCGREQKEGPLPPKYGFNDNKMGNRFQPGNPQGRFPANFIHDGSKEVMALFPDTGASKSGGKAGWQKGGYVGGKYEAISRTGYDEPKGSAARFFYCPKAATSERNFGLDSYLTVRYNSGKSITGGLSCENINMVVVQLLKRVMSESTVRWLNGESGESIMALCPKDSLYTILMEINKIIESKILNSLMLLLTNESTPGVKCEMENGGSPAENVENLKKWLLTITNGRMELALGVSDVALKMLLLTNAKENWKRFTNTHSTVKPLTLISYLCRLITPPNGLIVDMFMGSGTTAIATAQEGFRFIGIDQDEDACETSVQRLRLRQGVFNFQEALTWT